MYILAKTEYGDTLYWDGCEWREDPCYAERYGAMEGSWVKGTLQADYTEYNPRTYRGIRITYIYSIDD
ncbi:MAG: hypothetical protein J6B04_05135 [Clostridia bacterium]|nr:hypothetical protein [Clostridia bacterium]